MRFRVSVPYVMGALLCFIAGEIGAQTLVNPDISALGDIRTYVRPKDTADSLGVNRVDFVFQELELNFDGYLNPYMRADAYLGLHAAGGDIHTHLEEASITVLRGLPWRLQFLAGKYLLDFGRINTQHPHQWPWLEWPLMHKSMLGAEGLWPVGLQLSTMQPVGETAVKLSGNAFMSSYFGHDHDHGEADEHVDGEEEAPPDIMWSGRLSFFRSLSYYWQAELGLSGLYGTFDGTHDLEVAMADVDWKLKWRPDTYRSVSWIVESMYSDRDVLYQHSDADTSAGGDEHHFQVAKVTAWGVFSALEIQFRRVWIAGTCADYSQDATIQDAETGAVGVWIGYMPAEETARFTLVYRHETSDLNDMDNNELVFQIVWALGPHQPHGF